MPNEMMTCENCPSWDKEAETCKLPPSEMTSVLCILRHIAWVLDMEFINKEEERKEGEWWKNEENE